MIFISRLLMLAAVFAATPIAAQTAAQPGTTAQPGATVSAQSAGSDATAACVQTVSVAGAAQWLQILPERAPPTMTRLSFDEPSGGHAEVVWDPYDARGLARALLLTKGEWQVSFWAEPQRDSMAFANNYAWQARRQRCAASWSSEKRLIVEERRGDEFTAHVTISLMGATALPSLREGFSGGGGGATADSALSALRSLDVASLPGATSELVVQVVTRAVKKRALKLASRKVQALLCDVPKDAKTDAKPRLAKTCEAIRGIDLQTLSSAARPVALAISLDLLTQALAAVKIERRELIVDAIETGVTLLHDRPDLGPAEIKQVLLAAAAAYFDDTLDDAGSLAAQVALRVVAHCHDSGPCDAAMVRRLVLDPMPYFTLTGFEPEVIAAYVARAKDQVAQLEQLVAEGQRVFDTAKSMANVDRLRAAIRTDLRLVALAACFSNKLRCDQSKILIRLATHVSHGDLRSMVKDVADLAPGAIDDRLRRRLSIVLALVERAAAVVAASTEERKLAAAQVEAALDVVIDDAVDRDGRAGDWIFSLGTGVRAHAAYRLSGDALRGTASVPVAMSADRLCADDGEWWCLRDGWHFEVGFLDVGNYLRVKDVDVGDVDVDTESTRWTDLANLSVGAGVMFGSAELPAYVGVTGGIAPGDGDDGARGWRAYAGGYVGMYIPIIDLN